MVNNCTFLTASDVSKIMGISKSLAYKIIRTLNDDLKKEGYLTIAGKINSHYFESKIYPASNN